MHEPLIGGAEYTRAPVAALLLLVGSGCEAEQTDLCRSSEMASAQIGEDVSGEFSLLQEADELSVLPAPELGWGLGPLILRTHGIGAGDGYRVDVTIHLERAGVREPEIFVPDAHSLCEAQDLGGRIGGLWVLLGDEYQSYADLRPLDGQLFDIVAEVTDREGGAASVRQTVTVRFDE